MKLRPHHLLCTQGYSGKGYSENFVRNMTEITNYLRNEANATIDIVFTTDDICTECPQMLGSDYCRDNNKVKLYDKKVIEYFSLEEKSYIYKDIICEININMTEDMMDDICNDCCWYSVSACKNIIVNSKSKK